jgi:hypothetical protein
MRLFYRAFLMPLFSPVPIDNQGQRSAVMMRQLAHHLAHHKPLINNDLTLMRQCAKQDPVCAPLGDPAERSRRS